MMFSLEILVVIAASVAIVTGVSALVYMVVLTGLEERDRHRHTLANAYARRARTQSELSRHEGIDPLPMLAGRAGA